MEIIKRDGIIQVFYPEKIISAINKASNKAKEDISEIEYSHITDYITSQLGEKDIIDVEELQNIVEDSLMKYAPKVAKEYILYREEKSKTRKYYNLLLNLFEDEYNKAMLYLIRKKYNISFEPLYNRFISYYKEGVNKGDLLIKASSECITVDTPQWDSISGFLFYNKIECLSDKSKDFYEKIEEWTKEGLYNSKILSEYNKEEILELKEYSKSYNPQWDFTYSSLDLLYKRYLLRTKEGEVVETIPEMMMGIAMYLAIPEGFRKIVYAKKFYDELIRFNITVATPTLSNARKPNAQLSSCFIDTMEDSLDGIFKSISEFAKVSKWGGGMGMYIGKIRANRSDIRGFKGVAGGIIPWVRLLNDTAVAVNQLGVRAGSIAITLDIWHRDVPEFLQVRTNNGDDRMKAHDIFPSISIPDYFWHLVETDINAPWYLFCPHEIKTIMGFNLEDYWGEEWKKRYLQCCVEPNLPKRPIIVKELVRLIIKSLVETGTPFTFNRDTVNRANPIKDKGVIYSSNLCMEVLQNMTSFNKKQQGFDSDNNLIESYIPGEYVTCNLASLVLAKFKDWKTNEVVRNQAINTITTTVRMLDNVISINELPTNFAFITNLKYRAIGIGTSGYHHLLALEGITWESEEHIKYADELYEFINYHAIKASCELAKSKGKCEVFEGSDWDTGEYFTIRNYNDEKWNELKEDVHTNGIRNAYIMAIAPTGSTSIIANTTAGIDPIQKKFYLDEKKGSIIPKVAPDLNDSTYWLYKEAHHINHDYTIRACGARQRHIDQSQSLNFFITHNYSFKDILNMYLKAWKEGVKTTYYVRSQSLEVEECVSCSS